MMDELMSIIQTVMSDKKLMEFGLKGVKDLAAPVQSKIKDGMSIIEEAKIRACEDRSTMSIFAVMRLLKDPTVQDGLKFTKAFLSVVGERRQTDRC
jgi:uncharacterized protein YjgD (DUF1641 family)